MTKTLTEQWREGTLLSGEYYIKLDDGSFTTDKYFGKSGGFAEEIPVEVLSAVPSYDKYKQLVSKTEQLEKKLSIATKALEEIPDLAGNNENGINDYGIVCCAQDALKDMEGVK